MACCKNPTSPASQQIDKDLRERKKELQNEVNLLLLGPGDSGKSTIAKQLKLLYANGFTAEEKDHYRDVIRTNAVQCIKTLVINARGFEYVVDESNRETADFFEAANWFEVAFVPETGAKLYKLWQDPAIQKTYARASEFQLHGACQHVLNSTFAIFTPNYSPPDSDILMCRIRTCGAEQFVFSVGKTQFKIIDVGGQRSERRKWVHFFADVTAVLFIAAINEFDMQLYEDVKVNRLREALSLFENVVNTEVFKSTTIVLFMNKCDLFDAKIKTKNLAETFPEYTGPTGDSKAAKSFIASMFMATNKNSKTIFVHESVAVDTNCIQVIFLAVKETILQGALTVLL